MFNWRKKLVTSKPQKEKYANNVIVNIWNVDPEM